MENAEVARLLSEFADLLELTGGNPFRARAYRQAAQVVDLLPRPLWELEAKGELTSLPGVGEHIAAHVRQMLSTACFPEHDALAAKVPEGVLELLRLEGVGPKTVSSVWKRLGVTSVDGLEEACREGTVALLPRMGEARQNAILEAIARHRARRGRVPLFHALPYAEALAARLRQVPTVRQVECAGSLRRRRETVADLDLLVAGPEGCPLERALREDPQVAQVSASGPTKLVARLRGGLQVDVRLVPPTSFGAALHYFTGSKSHNIAVRTRAVRLGLKLSEYGVFDREGHRKGGEREEDVFRAVGLPWIPPELREGTGELEAAEEGRLPRLLEESDLRGDLHVHSDASSDGHASLEELAEQARRLGRRYLAITDHSRSRPLGLDEPRLLEHARRVRGFRGGPALLAGVEVDILPSGELDLSLEALATLDCVVASVHSHFHQPAAQMTRRLVKAIRSGVVHVLGHPTGRQLGTRDAYALDLEQVLRAAREEGVAVEVNATPERLDLPDQACRLAKELGVRLVIDTDAHVAGHLDNLRYGVWAARRGWLEAKDVLNTLPLEALRAALRRPPRAPRPGGPRRRATATPRR